MDDKLKNEIEAAVAEIFSQKEEADQRARTEEALQKSADTISELTTALEDKNSKEVEIAGNLTELEESIAGLTSELEAARNEVEESNTKLAESEKTIDDMKKDQAAELRMSELTKAGVTRSDKDGQKAKVREMDDEEFAAYRDELVDIREAVKAELAKAVKAAEETAAEETAEVEETEEEAASEEESEEESEEASEETEEETLPAEINRDTAVAAAMNLEVMPSDDIMAKYREMGKAMASRMNNTDDE